MAKGYFITGTDTNVGKTVLSALLCASLPARYWKPIQTGALEGTDRRQVIAWAGIAEDQALSETYLFDDPVSPHLAAERSGKEILLDAVALPCAGPLPLVVEGAGGVLAPINSDQFIADLIRHLRLPVVLAARSTLGTINHTLMSLQVLHSYKIEVGGVVLIGPENPENRRAIEHFGRVQVIGHIPVLKTIDRQNLLQVFAENFRREVFS
ncbi:MAG TPA: dethiobiotin synthase [Candidatus Angelobacter sp.]|jgi:dethiobiotin synthase|nr:dethiobiotin synthase [Candidatus Angelobacter sp.]